MKINKNLIKSFFIFSIITLFIACKKDYDTIQLDES